MLHDKPKINIIKFVNNHKLRITNDKDHDHSHYRCWIAHLLVDNLGSSKNSSSENNNFENGEFQIFSWLVKIIGQQSWKRFSSSIDLKKNNGNNDRQQCSPFRNSLFCTSLAYFSKLRCKNYSIDKFKEKIQIIHITLRSIILTPWH